MSKQKKENKQSAKNIKFGFSDRGWEDYLFWKDEDIGKLDTINKLLEECSRDPFNGTGKPEPLKGNLTGYWSRRIDREHRLVYLPEDHCIYVIQCRFHYSK